MKDERVDASFESYKGKKRFCVSHPEHASPLRVAAPSETTAIVAAAQAWGSRWQEYSFYAYCEVTRAYD